MAVHTFSLGKNYHHWGLSGIWIPGWKLRRRPCGHVAMVPGVGLGMIYMNALWIAIDIDTWHWVDAAAPPVEPSPVEWFWQIYYVFVVYECWRP